MYNFSRIFRVLVCLLFTLEEKVTAKYFQRNFSINPYKDSLIS